jgi:uncharacterized protein YmfQ (DUF2313 family)
MSVPANLASLLRLCPRGVWGLGEGSAGRALIEAVAGALDDCDALLEALLEEAFPDTTDVLLVRWEAELGILAIGGKTSAQRQAAVHAVLSTVPDTRPATMEAAVETYFGGDVDIVEPGPFRFDDPDSTFDSEDDVIGGAHVFFVRIAYAEAVSAGLDRDELLAFINARKQSHTVGLVQVDGLYFDDPYSLFDLDRFAV